MKRLHSVRSGTASLEFVMSLPLLAVLAAMTISSGFGYLGKSQVAIRARRDVWQKQTKHRDELNDSHAYIPYLPYPPLGGQLEGRVTKKVRSWNPLYPNGLEAASRNVILGGTWDHRDLPFDGYGPHFADVNPGIALAGIGALTSLFNMEGATASERQQGAEGMREARENALKQREEAKRQLDDARERLRQKRQELTAAKQRLNELEAEAEELVKMKKPVPAELQQQISATKAEIARLNNEVRALENEVRAREDGLNQLDDAISQMPAG